MRTTTLFILGILALAGGYLGLHQSQTTVREQISQILLQDQTASVDPAQLATLRTYVEDHMGTSAKFVLNGTYTRAQQAATAAAVAEQPSGSVYQQAQAACASIKNAVDQAQCNEQYLAAHLQPATTAPAVTEPQIASYTYAWMAPVWTPDLTGWLLAAGILLLLAGAFRLIWHR